MTLITYDAVQQHYGTWLLGYPWEIYGTGTYRDAVSASRADVLFKRFTERLGQRLHRKVSYVAYLERNPNRHPGLGMSPSHYHWHYLAAAQGVVDLATAADEIWSKLFGNAKVEPFRADSNGTYYVSKGVSDPDSHWRMGGLDYLEYAGCTDLLGAAKLDDSVPDHLKEKVFGKYLRVRHEQAP